VYLRCCVFLGFEIPISWFVAFSAVLVILLAPLQLALLPKLKQSISLGCFVALRLLASSLSLAVFPPTTLWSTRVSMAWLAASLTFFVVTKLLITPLGLSLLLRNAPTRFVGLVTGLWFGAGALGYWLGREIGAL
jgi:dipeptide/tripeptide permease